LVAIYTNNFKSDKANKKTNININKAAGEEHTTNKNYVKTQNGASYTFVFEKPQAPRQCL
jgi:hypothetical protein